MMNESEKDIDGNGDNYERNDSQNALHPTSLSASDPRSNDRVVVDQNVTPDAVQLEVNSNLAVGLEIMGGLHDDAHPAERTPNIVFVELPNDPAPIPPNFIGDGNNNMIYDEKNQLADSGKRGKPYDFVELPPDRPPLPPHYVGSESDENHNLKKALADCAEGNLDFVELPADQPPFPPNFINGGNEKKYEFMSGSMESKPSHIAANIRRIRLRGENAYHQSSPSSTQKIRFTDHSSNAANYTQRANNDSPICSAAVTIEAPLEAIVTIVPTVGTIDDSSSPSQDERDDFAAIIPEAFLVEEEKNEDIAIAEIMPPWWKQKRTYCLMIAVVCIVITVALASRSQIANPKEVSGAVSTTVAVGSTSVDVKSASNVAGSFSLAPSSSQFPSTRPTACVSKTSLQGQSLEFGNFNLSYPKAVIDSGRAIRAGILVENDGSLTFDVVFYKLTSYQSWEQKNRFLENIFMPIYSNEVEFSVALSGQIALIGTPLEANETGAVLVYEYSTKYDQWEKNEDAMEQLNAGQHGSRFGYFVAIDTDLAIIGAPGSGTIHVYRQVGSNWTTSTSYDIPNGTTSIVLKCDTITISTSDYSLHVLQYNRTGDIITVLQDPLEIPDGVATEYEFLALSDFHLSYPVSNHFYQYDYTNDPYRAIVIVPVYDIYLFHRSSTSQPFEYIQFLNSSYYGDGFGPGVAVEEDILLVKGARNKIHVFVFENGQWRNSLVLTNPTSSDYGDLYNRISVSKRNVLVSTDNDVIAYNIEECAPMPSSVPSSTPSVTPTKSCCEITVSIDYFTGTPNPIEWHVLEVVETSESNNTSAMSPTSKPTWEKYALVGYDPLLIISKVERKCLQKGGYEFIIMNDPVHYNVTLNGEIIAEGGDFGYTQSTLFQLPPSCSD